MSAFDGNVTFLSGYMSDISTAGQIYIPVPDDAAGDIVEIRSALNGTIATGDATLTPKIGGTAVTNGALTVTASGSAAGDVDVSRPTGARTVAAGDAIEIETDGASENTIEVWFTVAIKR